MPAPRTSLRVCALLLAPLLAVAGALPATSLFRCRHDGVLRVATCCGDQDEPETGGPGPVWSESSCCLRETVEVDATASALLADDGAKVAPPALLAVPAPALCAPLAWTGTARPTSAHASGPPILRRTQALLI